MYEPATCFDGTQNQTETAIDRGGPCTLLDERSLTPHAVLFSRAFPSRPGFHNAVAYIENPNANAAVPAIPYRFTLHDENGILVAEREGVAFIMPNAITPIFEGTIPTGNRAVARTFFEFRAPLVWERAESSTDDIEVSGRVVSRTDGRVSAAVENTGVADKDNILFVAVVFNTAGNAFAASQTTVVRLSPDRKENITFSWPQGLPESVARVDILPVLKPSIR